MNILHRLIGMAAISAVAVLAGGCATSNTPGDPFEGFNRGVFGFNEGVDQAIVKPIAKGYTAVVPEPARDCVRNMFANIEDIFNGINSLLQGKVVDAGSDVGRLAVNSTVGVLGCFDVASKMGLEKHNRDFGQTFGKWGMATGPYLVIPFIGVSNLRDDIGNNPVRLKLGMPKQFGSCHTATVGGYVIEGHVPVREIRRLLREKPAAVGLAVPGMPVGSPGMDGPAYNNRQDRYDVLLVARDGSAAIFQTYRP